MVELEPMSEAVFPAYLAGLQQRYAAELAQAWGLEDSRPAQFAQLQLAALLPQGLQTVGHRLCEIRHGREPAGVIWFSAEPGTMAFIYDIIVEPSLRQQGIGRVALQRVERQARENGCFALVLHVFASNERARSFYQHVGFDVIGVQMHKPLK